MNHNTPDLVIQPAGGMLPDAVLVSAKTPAGRAWVDANRLPHLPRDPEYVMLCHRAVLPRIEQAERTGLVVRMIPNPVSPWDAPALPPVPGDAQ